MATNRFFHSVLLAAGVLLMTACASQPVSTLGSATVPATAPAPLLEKKFQQVARSYRVYQKNGETLYCKKDKPITSAIPLMQCLSESQLRLEVENLERSRNPVQRPVIGTVGSIG